MDRRPLLFLDSGIGGLPYCQYFNRCNPGESLIYVADRANFPYGPKEKEELIASLTGLIGALAETFNPKLVAVVCNTATVSALDGLRSRFPGIPFVGTVPAVKPAVTESRKQHIGVLGTERTVRDPYIRELAARYAPECRVTALAAPELVEWVEYRQACSTVEERRAQAEPYVASFRQAGADAVVLGCTHFRVLLAEFQAAAAPDIRLYHSVEGVSRRIEAVLDKEHLRGAPGPEPEPSRTLLSEGEEPRRLPRASGFLGSSLPDKLLILTGKDEADGIWQKRANEFGFSLRSFEGPS
jgi:glutamate racemase